jgi:hypothetical protein
VSTKYSALKLSVFAADITVDITAILSAIIYTDRATVFASVDNSKLSADDSTLFAA